MDHESKLVHKVGRDFRCVLCLRKFNVFCLTLKAFPKIHLKREK